MYFFQSFEIISNFKFPLFNQAGKISLSDSIHIIICKFFSSLRNMSANWHMIVNGIIKPYKTGVYYLYYLHAIILFNAFLFIKRVGKRKYHKHCRRCACVLFVTWVPIHQWHFLAFLFTIMNYLCVYIFF